MKVKVRSRVATCRVCSFVWLLLLLCLTCCVCVEGVGGPSADKGKGKVVENFEPKPQPRAPLPLQQFVEQYLQQQSQLQRPQKQQQEHSRLFASSTSLQQSLAQTQQQHSTQNQHFTQTTAAAAPSQDHVVAILSLNDLLKDEPMLDILALSTPSQQILHRFLQQTQLPQSLFFTREGRLNSLIHKNPTVLRLRRQLMKIQLDFEEAQAQLKQQKITPQQFNHMQQQCNQRFNDMVKQQNQLREVEQNLDQRNAATVNKMKTQHQHHHQQQQQVASAATTARTHSTLTQKTAGQAAASHSYVNAKPHTASPSSHIAVASAFSSAAQSSKSKPTVRFFGLLDQLEQQQQQRTTRHQQHAQTKQQQQGSAGVGQSGKGDILSPVPVSIVSHSHQVSHPFGRNRFLHSLPPLWQQRLLQQQTQFEQSILQQFAEAAVMIPNLFDLVEEDEVIKALQSKLQGIARHAFQQYAQHRRTNTLNSLELQHLGGQVKEAINQLKNHFFNSSYYIRAWLKAQHKQQQQSQQQQQAAKRQKH